MPVPLGCGLGLKPQHFSEVLAACAPGLWFEVHAENYMVEGGPRLAWLLQVRERHPVSLHGVGLSLAAEADPDPVHLARLARLAGQCEPVLLSEHLAWSVWRGRYYPDLLPVLRTRDRLARIADNIGRVQDALGRALVIEHPAHYLELAHEMDETDFLSRLVRISGCRLLVDVNNAYVSANNLGYRAEDWLDALPASAIAEVHLAGYSEDPHYGARLLVDSHDAPVAGAVWSLYRRLLERIGPRPTLIERDGHIPAFDVLMAERQRAQHMLEAVSGKRAA